MYKSRSDRLITFKPHGVPLKTLAAKPNLLWINLIPAKVESNEGKIISVCFDVSEFSKGKTEFENENTGSRNIELCLSVSPKLIHILDESLGNAEHWLGQFKHGDEYLSKCTLHQLYQIRDELQRAHASDPKVELALATFIMLQYDAEVNTSNSVTAMHMSTLMEKLEPFALSTLEKMVGDIVADLTQLDDRTIMMEPIQTYLKTRNKTLTMTNGVAAVVQQQCTSPSEFVKKTERLKAFALHLRLVLNGLRRSSSVALTTSDLFSLPERISAAITACTIMKKISVSSDRQCVLNAQDAVWQLIQLSAGIQVIFFSVTVIESSAQGAPSIFVVEWLASTTDLSRRIQGDPIKLLLQNSQEAFSESRIVLLSAVNAADFNGKSATKQRSKRFKELYSRKLRSIQNAVGIAQPHALFLYVNDTLDSR